MTISWDPYKLHKFVTLMVDVMFFNGNSFVIALARKLKLVTAKHIPSLTEGQFRKSLNKVIKLYRLVGFIIQVLQMGI